MTRRGVLLSSFGAATAAAFGPGAWATAAEPPIRLQAVRRTIEVSGRAADVFGLIRQDGGHGVRFTAGSAFRVVLENRLAEPTLVHWHGLTPPSDQDGVPGLSQDPIPGDGSHPYDFPLLEPGTYWMHSHLGLQEQRLLAAPLIVDDPADTGRDEQEVVVMLHDFSFRPAEEIYAGLRGGMMPSMDDGTMDHSAMGHGADGAQTGARSRYDLNDVAFDAYLANDRTLADPELVQVERGGRVRLRIINAAAATNFVIDLGDIGGELIAVDGRGVMPVTGARFEIAIAQRLDVRLRLPGAGSVPVLAQREGDVARTGIVLRTPGATVAKVSERASSATPPLGLSQEIGLRAISPLPGKMADRRIDIALAGGMMPYAWGLGHRGDGAMAEYVIRRGERVEMTFINRTGMAHPMHLHGHTFQVVAVDGRPISGALRDTVLVPPDTTVTVAFDANNYGLWAVHCHNLYHMVAGMMGTVRYAA